MATSSRPPLRPHCGTSFHRAHGLGNDYLVCEAVPADGDHHGWTATPAAVQAVCHRTRGVGGDGIVVLVGEDRPFPLRMFNPDGSEFERSGNGLRILASYLHRTGRVETDEPFTVVSGGDEIGMRVHSARDGLYDVSVEMGRARLGAAAVELDPARTDSGRNGGFEGAVGLELDDGREVVLVPVSVGNPHAVVFGAPEPFAALDDRTLHAIGSRLAIDPGFAHGTNVQLARVHPPDRVEILIWERGVGPTEASGTSSCAAAVAAVATGQLAPGGVRVTMPGGELAVTVTERLDVVLRGPVGEVGTARMDPGFVRRLAGPDGPGADRD